jgi:hypothetical protein
LFIWIRVQLHFINRCFPQKKGDHPVVWHVCGVDGVLGGVELGKAHRRVGVDEGLLVDAPHTLDGAHIIGVLRAQVAHVLGLDLAHGGLLLLGLFKGLIWFSVSTLPVSATTFSRAARRFLKVSKAVTQPHAAHAARRDEHALQAQGVADPFLTQAGIIKGKARTAFSTSSGTRFLMQGLRRFFR